MNIFILPSETLATINALPPVFVGSFSLTVLMAVIYALALVIRRVRTGKLTVQWIYGLLALAWLPLGISFMISMIRDVRDTWPVVGRSTEEQAVWRYCHIDLRQGLGGGLCRLPDFVTEVKRLVPAGASVGYWPSGFEAHLNYYLYDSYTIEHPQNAEYLIVYYPSAQLKYEAGKISRISSTGAEVFKDTYIPFANFGSNMAIFKKQTL